MVSSVREDAMGTETRIGILTGLVIVVVASVYFFYGNDSPDEEFLIATGNQISQPPKIPLSSEQKALSPHTGDRADASRRIADGAARRAAAPQSSAEGDQPSPHSRQRKVPPQRLADARRTPIGTPALREASPGAGAATPLRTGPSQDLIDATNKNLEESGSEEHLALGDDGTSRKSDIARIIDRLRTDKPAESPAAQQPAPTDTNREARTSSPRAATQTPAASNERSARTVTPDRRTAATRRHTIARNDTLEGIALRYFNDRRRVDDIMRANPGIDPRRLKIGDEIILPAAAPTQTAADDTVAGNRSTATDRAERTAPAKTHTVREDESFYSIAQARLGSGARWRELFELNRALVKDDPRRLRPGMVLQLPN